MRESKAARPVGGSDDRMTDKQASGMDAIGCHGHA